MACRLPILIALILGASSIGCGEPDPPRHAVVLVIDTLRADAIEHAATPNLDALLERGERARIAWSASTWTIPSVLSLHTGTHVREHGWDFNLRSQAFPQMAERPTLATVLAEQGFSTVALYGNRILELPLGLARGFEGFRYVVDAELPEAVRAELAGWSDDRRHFLYVHLLGPHEPLLPSPAARARWGLEGAVPEGGLTIAWASEKRPPAQAEKSRGLYRRAYWAALEDTDERIGEIVRALEPHLAETVLVFTSDHGEMLGERDRFGHHRRWLDEPLTRVPFAALNAGALPPIVNGAAVPHLLTRALGVEHDWSVRVDAASPLVSQRRGKLALSPDGASKGVWSVSGALQVWDVAGYPAQRREKGRQRAALQAARRAFQAAVPVGDTDTDSAPIDAEMLDALRLLGYVDDEADASSP